MKIRIITLLIFVLGFSSVSKGQDWRLDLKKYINKLAKDDGGYGWEDQYDSHLTPTFAVAGIFYHTDNLPKDKNALAEFIRTHHPQTGPNKEAGGSGAQMRNLTYEQIQAIRWMGGDVSSFIPEVSAWKSQKGVLANYEGHNYAGLFQETMTPISSKLLGIKMANPEVFIKYLESCRRSNGSFNNAPTSAGGDGNILNTWWGLYAQQSLGVNKSKVEETAKWLQSCQLKSGGFTHQPNPQIGVNDDVIYTWAGIKSLDLLGAKPADVKSAIDYLVSLRNEDGGFGSRPGLYSTPMATYYAIESLKLLNGFEALNKRAPNKIIEPKQDFKGYNVYSVQFQAHGSGSPEEAVMIADSLNIHLWGVKYPLDGWLEKAQQIADARKVNVRFFISNEPHDNEVAISGMGSFNHVLDYIAPGGSDVHFSDSASFDQLKNTTLEELKKVNGGLMLQVSNNEPLARLMLDESINNFGYLAISTVHFGQNFMFWLPYIGEYRYRLPLVTLQDAHGPESWWWLTEYTNHRTLFIAKEPSYEGMITALKNNWVAGVRHDELSNFKTRMLGGTSAARDFIKSNTKSWQWWDSEDRVSSRPAFALTILTPESKFEAGRPESGVAIRVRCDWDNNRQTLRAPASELVSLEVDGSMVSAELVTVKGRGTNPTDSYYIYKMPELSRGEHQIVAKVKGIKTGEIKEIRSNFSY